MALFASKTALFPYYWILKLRHKLYDFKIIKSHKFDTPIISIGNITVGGTGKTPHTEMVLREFSEEFRIATLSRGYKRDSKGYREVSLLDDYKSVGDEPLQMKKKFPNNIIAVDRSRKNGIGKLLQLPEEVKPTLIVLDDAFQHRKVTPTLSIVLVDFSRPIFSDNLLPIGRLRDLPKEIKRADIVIVTKTPGYITDKEKSQWRKDLRLKKSQNLFFTLYDTVEPKAIFPKAIDNRFLYSPKAIYFTGIADDLSFKKGLSNRYKISDGIKFSDHRDFTDSDLKEVGKLIKKHPTAVLFTTEKDAQRVSKRDNISNIMQQRLFYIPIEVKFIPEEDKNIFKKEINSRIEG